MIVQYYSDSLGLSRPGYIALGQRYITLFEKWLRENTDQDVFVIDRAKGGATIDILYEAFEHDESYVSGQKDILIIHEGICDCAPRPVPKKVRDLISRFPTRVRGKVIGLIHKNRARLLQSGFKSCLVEKRRYEEILSGWLDKASKNFDRIYVINIAPTTPEIEAHSPGLTASIKEYNEIISRVIREKKSESISLIDNYDLIANEGDIENYILKEDGHHLTAAAHELLASRLIDLETKNNKNLLDRA